MTVRIIVGDALARLAELPAGSVRCCVTSPPYFGLRDYGTGTWDGGDPTCDHRVGNQVQDTKAPGAIAAGMRPGTDASRCRLCGATRTDSQIGLEATPDEYVASLIAVFREVRRVLADDGTVWCNLGDSYNAAGREGHGTRIGFKQGREMGKKGGVLQATTRNKRTVWTVATQGFSDAHFATFPPALIEPCILAGSARGDTVLDPFGGAGTTGLVADRLGRHAVLIELNPEYATMAERRIRSDAPLLVDCVGGAP